ncbi:MAG: ribosome biogenesis GTPase Der [Clostridiales bacterium]|nr:ribosome biogenesis GTPase Der [Clostridiales bacterium]MBD9209355.1 ribosome biogenesis GTPase Der [Clostridiales bacterium]
MAKTVVAIVGRANVGKSTLFNKIAGERVSIVEDVPGVTRDRIYYDTEWNGKPIMMIDTGGFEPASEDTIKSKMREQAQIAIEMADVIVFLCDVRAGVTPDDRDIGTMLMKSGKPVIVAVNKVDSIGALPMEYYEFYELGFDGDPIALSSLHGTGTGDLLDRILELSPVADAPEEEDDDTIKVAVIGKPNAGKSSLVNRILGEDRMIVSDIAGTTRDAIDSRVENEYGKYTFIDTAGIRRQSKVTDKIEKFSVLRAHSAVERADVCLIMIDAAEGITEQDEKIAGLAHEGGKGSIIVVNKWDKIEKDNGTVKKFTDDIYLALSYMTYAPIMFISAKTGQRTEKLFEKINFVAEKNAMRISTGMLNDVLSDAISRVQPPTDKGKRLKIYYMTQVSTKPPTFVVFCNDAQLFHFSYQRYIENKLREVFGFEGTPIRFIIRERSDEDKD